MGPTYQQLIPLLMSLHQTKNVSIPSLVNQTENEAVPSHKSGTGPSHFTLTPNQTLHNLDGVKRKEEDRVGVMRRVIGD
jgi:shikimate kinase